MPMVSSTDTQPVISEQETVSTNPNRITMYLTPDERARMQRLAEQLTAQGVNGVVDKEGVVMIKALVRYLVETALRNTDDAVS